MIPISRGESCSQRRAITAVLVLVMVPMLLAVAALTIDVGAMINARADLQDAADAAAMAGASAYISDEMMLVREGAEGTTALNEVLYSAVERAAAFSLLNTTLGGAGILLEPGDVVTGWIDVTSATSPIQTSPAPEDYNSVQVTVRRTLDSTNGPVDLFFAPIFNRLYGEVTATATAVFDDHAGGFDVSKGPGLLMPFTINEDEYKAQLVSGDDQYEYDPDSDSVSFNSDGVKEINLYPYNMAPGNFGLLNIGTPNQGEPALADQIENGTSPEDMELETGSPVLTFYDEGGDPVTYSITGDPGMKVALEPSVEMRKGDLVAFFLHDQVTDGGSNTVYRITDVCFGLVMDVNLTGESSTQGLWIQPAAYVGPAVVLSRNAPSSGGMAGQLMLAR